MTQHYSFPVICLLLLLFIAFLIPDLFINRHITLGILSINSIAIMLIFWILSHKKTIIISKSVLTAGSFVFYWTIWQFCSEGSSPSERIMFLSLLLLYIAYSQHSFYRKDLYQLYSIVSFSGVCMSCWGILQYLNLVEIYHLKYPVTGNFDNPAGIAIFLGAILPFSMFFISSNEKRIKLWGIFSSCILTGTILLSGSRTGVLIILPAYLLAFCQNKNRLRFQKFIRRFWWLLLVACFFLFIGLYFWKIDSANGRILIWTCSWNMFLDHWIIGTGEGGFTANYMSYQAEYFRQNPDSIFSILADNVQTPFNEFLAFAVQYGTVGLCFFGLFIARIIQVYGQCNQKAILHPVGTSLLAIAIASCFSYPLKYPLICLILMLNLAILSTKDKCIFQSITGWKLNVFRFIGYSICILFLTWTFNWIHAERKWFVITYSRSSDRWKKYHDLHEWLGKDGMFLYNHAAALHRDKQYKESLIVLTLCTRYFNDFDVQLLLADNYYHLGNLYAAECCYLTAARMCPNRFLPLYHLVNLYELKGDRKMVEKTVLDIKNKKVKVPSIIIDDIKDKMKQKYNELLLEKDDF